MTVSAPLTLLVLFALAAQSFSAALLALVWNCRGARSTGRGAPSARRRRVGRRSAPATAVLCATTGAGCALFLPPGSIVPALLLALVGAPAACGLLWLLAAARLERAGRIAPARALGRFAGKSVVAGAVPFVGALAWLSAGSATADIARVAAALGCATAAAAVALLGGLSAKPQQSATAATVLWAAATAVAVVAVVAA